MTVMNKSELLAAAFTIQGASNYTGIGRSKLYELAAEGHITVRKMGRKSLILRRELDALLEGAAVKRFVPKGSTQ